MSRSKAPVFLRFHALLAVVIGAILVMVAYCAGDVLLVSLQTPELIHSAMASNWVHIRAADLSVWRKCVLVTVEDPDFYGDPGVRHSIRAAFTNRAITQTVVQKLYFADYKPGIRRMNQKLIACYVLDRIASKDDQLTLFVNAASFGRRSTGEAIVGFTHAAGEYFDKPLAQLSEEQYLSLVAMLADPQRFDPRTHPRESAERVASLKGLVIDRCGQEKRDAPVRKSPIPG